MPALCHNSCEAVIASSSLRCVVTLVPSKVAGRKGGGERQGIKKTRKGYLEREVKRKSKTGKSAFVKSIV